MMHYDKDGLPISVQSFGVLMQSPTYRIVQNDEALDGAWISTVWLGLDHGFGSGKKKIFETMVFSGKDNSHIEEQYRYSTFAEAVKGHAAIVEEHNKRPRHHLRKLEP